MKIRNLKVIIFILDLLIFLVCILVNIAFITLLERKILGYSQIRLGPNKPAFNGLAQPFADAIKLFRKNFLVPRNRHYWIFLVSPTIALILVLLIWRIYPVRFNLINATYGFIFIIIVMRINIYPIILAGWSSTNKYALIGRLRGVAQTISYEIRLALIILIVILLTKRFRLYYFQTNNLYFSTLIFIPYIFILWLISALAETNRTPFDFAEGESELVSGFNIEYGGIGFAIIFIAEYGRIYFLSAVTIILFFSFFRLCFQLVLISIIIRSWIWVRTTFPRYRYDLLINLAWKIILPVVLSANILYTRIIFI